METTNVIKQQKNIKLYTINAIIFAMVLGGPFAAVYLMSKNFESLNNKKFASNTLKIGTIATLLFFGLFTLFVPKSIQDQMPIFTLPTIYGSIIYVFMMKYQNKDIKEHLKNNGAKQSVFKATGIAILSLIISMLYLLILIMLFP